MDKFSGLDPGIAALLARAPNVELEYGFVIDCLKNYPYPRRKLHHLLKIGALVRVKKGFYIFGKNIARRPFCPEVLANMLYGPSYVSLEWACQYHRLIPEKVVTITSVCAKRSRSFSTPIGTFTYEHIHPAIYPWGVSLIPCGDGRLALMATKEKALVDLLIVRRGSIRSTTEMRMILFDDLRVEDEDLLDFDVERLKRIEAAHAHKATEQLIKIVEKLKETR